MNERRKPPSIAPPTPRHAVEIVAGITILLIALLTLVPFDFASSRSTAEAFDRFTARTSEGAALNVVSNVALFVPLGIALEWILRRRRCRGPFAFAGAVMSAGAFSGSVEWLQAYSPSRVSSWVDFIANVGGAAIGAALAGAVRWFLPATFTQIVLSLRRDAGAVLVWGYVLLLMGFAVMPFTFATDGVRMRQVLREATFVPLAELDAPGPSFAMPTTVLPGDEGAWAAHLRQRWMGGWALEGISFAMLAWMIFPRLRGRYRFGVGAAGLLTLWATALFAVLLSVVQIPLLTRGFHVTEIIARILGAGLGLVIVVLREGGSAGRVRVPLRTRVDRLGWIGVAGATIWIVYSGLIPWIQWRAFDDFSALAATIETTPFSAYFASRFDVVVADVMGIAAGFGALGALLSLSWRRLRACGAVGRCLGAGLCGTALALPVEVAQIFIRTRVPGIEDVLLAGIAAAIGAGVAARLVHFLKWALADETRVRRPALHRPTWGPTDELIATLIEPREDAPIERSPTQRPRRGQGATHT
jgi:VanZ family protein